MKHFYFKNFFTLIFILTGFTAFSQVPVFEINNIKHPCDGQSNGSFEVLVTAGAPEFSLYVFGSRNGQAINGVPITQGEPFVVDQMNPGNILVVVSNSAGQASSNNVSLVATSAVSIDDYVLTHNTCQDETPSGGISLSVSGGTGNYSYSFDGGNTFVSLPIRNLAGGEYTLTVFDEGTSCSDEITFTIDDQLSLTTINPAPLCSDEGLIDLTAYATPSVNGGEFTFTGEGVSGNNFDPSAVVFDEGSASSSVSVNVFYEVNGCSTTETIVITVNEVPNPPTPAAVISPVCEDTDAPVVTLEGENILIYSDAALTTQVGSGNTFDPESDPAFSTATGGIAFTYYATQQLNGCTSEAFPFHIPVIENPEAVFATNALEVCQNEDAALRVNLSGVAPYELTYEANGEETTVTGINEDFYLISFDSLQANVSVKLINIKGSTGCEQALSETATITVNALPAVTLAAFSDVCDKDPAFALSGGTPAGGTYSGKGVDSSTGWFNPADAGEGDHIITYTYTDANGCTNFAESTLTVNPLPEVTLAGFADVCAEDKPFELSGGTPAGGVYSGPGVVDSLGTYFFKPFAVEAGTHSITYTYTVDSSSCENSAQNTITVNPMRAPVLNLKVSETEVCAGNSVTFSADVTDGGTNPTYNWYLNGELVADNNTDTYTFEPKDGDEVYLEFTQGTLDCGTGETVLSPVQAITVNEQPTASIAEDATICEGGDATLTLNFTGTAPFSVQYSNGTDTLTLASAIASMELTVSPAVTTTYTIISVADEKCSRTVAGESATITVNESSIPLVNITPVSAEVCQGAEVNFTASATNAGTDATYTWFVNELAVLSGINETAYTYSPADGDTVYVQLTQGTIECGTGETVNSNKAGIKVESAPDVTFTGPATVCLAEVPVSYSPTVAGGTFSSSVAGVISAEGNFSPDTAGLYTIYYSITSTLGCSSIDSMSVQVNPVDAVSVELSVDQAEACGTTNEFVFNASITNGGDNPGIRWFIDGVEQKGETEATFTVANPPSDSVYNVSVAVTQDNSTMLCGNGATVTDNESITVYQSPVATLSTTDATTICKGESISLQFNFSGTAPFELAYTNGTDTTSLSGITENILSVSVQPSEGQVYRVVSFADASSCTTSFSGEVNVSVNDVPAGVPANLQATTIACSEISVGWDGTVNSQAYQIRWSADPAFESGVGSDTVSVTTATISGLSGGATYYIEVTALNACGAAENSAVTNVTLPETVAAPENITITEENCDGFTVAWNKVAGAESYALDLATDAAFENFVEGYNAFSTTDTTELVNGLEPVNYYLRLRSIDSCGISQNSVVVQIDLSKYVMDSLSASITSVKCADDSTGSISALVAYYNELAVEADETTFTFLWNTGATTSRIDNQPAGEYWVEVTNVAGCSIRDTFEITQPQPIVLEVNQEDVSCFGDSTGTATVSISGGVEDYSIVWTNSNAEVLATDTSHIYQLAAGKYFVNVTDANSCVARDSVTITQPEQLILTVDNIQNVSCPSDSTGSISVSVAGGAGSYRYVWHTLSVAEDQFTVSNLPAGNYPLTVYDALNCSISDTLQISSTHPPVVVNLGPDRCETESAVLDAGFDIADYAISWSTGETTQTITVTESGSYAVEVSSRSSGCVGTDTVNINIGEPIAASVEIDLLEDESCSGTEFVVVANAQNAGAAPDYQWYLNTKRVGVNSDTLRLTNFAEGDTIHVVVQPDVSSSCVAAENAGDTLIISTPWLQAPVIEAAQLEVCGEETISVVAEGENIRWYLNAISEETFLQQGNTLSYTTAEVADTIYLLATQQLGSCNPGRADTLEVIIRSTVAPVIPEDITRCGNEPLPVIVAEGENIRWYADAAQSLFINEGSTLELTALTGSDRITTDTTFYASQTINGCTSLVDSVTITTLATPVVNLGPDIVRCSPAEVVLNAGYNPADGYFIEWINTGATTQTDTVSQTGNYRVRVTHIESGCSAEDEVVVTISEEISSRVDINALSEINCGTESLQLEAGVVNNGENPTYTWFLNGTLLEGETGAVLTLSNYADQDSVSVSVNVDLECATENPVSNYFNIEMPELAPVTLSSTAETVCIGEANPEFTASNMLEGSVIRWYKGAVHADSLVAEGTSTYTPEVSEAGTYTYLVTQTTERCGTSEAASMDLTINGDADCAPACDFTPTASIEILPGTVLCEDITTISLRADTVEVGPNASYTWFYEGTEIGTGITFDYSRAEGFTDGAEVSLLVNINDEANACNGVETIEQSVALSISSQVQATLSINPVDPVCLSSEGQVTFNATGTYIDWRAQGLVTNLSWYLDGVLMQTATLEPESSEAALSFSIAISELTENSRLELMAELDESLACVLAPGTAEYQIPVAEALAPSVSLNSSAGADGVCPDTSINFTAVATNAGEEPVYTWYVQKEGEVAVEMQSGLSNAYTHNNPAANAQVWVTITTDAETNLCFSAKEATSTAYTIVIKSEEDCADGGGGGEFNCNAFSIELLQKDEPSCGENNGYLKYAVSGGVSPYTVRYTFTETSIPEVLHGDVVEVDIENIPANTYGSLSIVDAAGNSCSLDSISLPMAPRISATLTKAANGDVTCHGEEMGKARLEITGGNEPFQYKISEEEGWVTVPGRLLDFNNLPAGLNTVLVRDNEGDECMTSATVEIMSLYPPLEIVSFDTEDANCNDDMGKIWINEIEGGNGGPYRIKLQNEQSFRDFDPSVPFEGLIRGQYNVVVTDGTCEITREIRVGSPGLIAIDYELIPYDCENPGLKAGLYASINPDLTEVEGEFEASISKRNETGEYVVVPGLEAIRFTQGELYQYGMENGTYSIEVRNVDRKGCPENISGIVIEDSEMPSAITFTHTPEHIYCVDAVGGVTVTELSGARNAAYIISIYQNDRLVRERTIENAEYVVNNGKEGVYRISDLPAGIYRMMVSQEQGGCEGIETSEPVAFRIEENPSMLYAEVVEKTKSFPERGSAKLKLAVQTNSGQEPYLSSIYLVEPLFPGQQYVSEEDTVQYNPIEATFEHTYEGLPAGVYELYVSDANGCTFFIQDTIAHDESLFIPNVITPNNDGYNEVFYVRNIPPSGTRLIITNRWGKVVYSTKNYQNDWTGSDMEDGVYYYHLLVAGGEGTEMKGWVEIRRGTRP
ncbi:T9SS type B sorting domain-containing protein [Nafulsella turpanensis]|uniref:T9SS type B sorting domain-containing protein n=1 Tax=Nafulsella turpanensis TaxID=1265690 RepID=UPI0003471677|nr:gliding motility-associated C-terminal domain-containing protein [Nafulsella turpanensis]